MQDLWSTSCSYREKGLLRNMYVTDDLRSQLVADIMNQATDEFGRFLTDDQHLRMTEIILERVRKCFSPHIWNVIGECLKADQLWQEREGYHCNCEDMIGEKPDPRPCPEHGKKKK